jgi:hypothetical protein
MWCFVAGNIPKFWRNLLLGQNNRENLNVIYGREEGVVIGSLIGSVSVPPPLPNHVSSSPLSSLFYSLDGCARLLRNVGTYLSDYMMSRPGRP